MKSFAISTAFLIVIIVVVEWYCHGDIMVFGKICAAIHLFILKLLLFKKITRQSRLQNKKKIAVNIHEV